MPNVSRAFGGPTESLIGYVSAASTQGITAHIAAPGVGNEDREWLVNALPPSATLHEFTSLGRHAWVVAPGLWTWLVINGHRFDAVHVHGLFNPISSISARIAAARDMPLVMRPFGTLSKYTFSRRSKLKNLYFRLLDRPALLQANTIHFTTEAEREEAKRHNLSMTGRSHVIPPPWRGDIEEIDQDDKTKHPTVLFMSRLHPKKNVLGLLEAWQNVSQEHPRAELIIAGSGEDEYVDMLHARVRDLGIEHSVSFPGFVTGEDKARLLKTSWLFVLPSHQENFGVAVLEALAAGLPVVISDAVQLDAFVTANDLGKVVPRETPAISSALTTALDDPKWLSDRAKRAPTIVADQFSLEQIGKQLKAMYEAIS
nr:glycosyltransferase [Longibacter salinarum]